jgi:hypothetical protein
MIEGRWKSKAKYNMPANDNKAFEPLFITGDDISQLSRSPVCRIRGVQPLSGFRFFVGGKNLLPTVKRFHILFHDVLPALWAWEVCILISHAPSELNHMLEVGNYNALSKLTGDFHFFANPIEYYLELGRCLAFFHSIGEKESFPTPIMTIAINNYNNMIVASDKLQSDTISKAFLAMDSLDGVKSCTSTRALAPASLQILKSAFIEKKSLKDLGSGAIELFTGYSPRRHMPHRMGLIRECQLNYSSRIPTTVSVPDGSVSSN